MKSLHHFTLPIMGLKMGVHQFDFQVDSEFFRHFDQSVIKQGNFDVRLYFDKRPDMIVLIFDFEGEVETICDRCLATINLPVKGNNQLMVKYAEAESEEDEIWYIPSGTSEINVAKPVYEFLTLSLPIIKNCEDTEKSSCDEEMLRYLQPSDEEETPDEDDESPNPFRDAFKDFK